MRPWLAWSLISCLMIGYLGYAITVKRSPAKTSLLPGKTTHGHYQIEMACDVCHTPLLGVKQDACLGCHQEELKMANDTHPAKKFNDPTNADRLAVLDARNCITCHREHVPDRTHSMGLSLPPDYCYHCHQDIVTQRPSHATFAFDSCATAGCHNYHDNTALYENFLAQHWGEPNILDTATIPIHQASLPKAEALSVAEQDSPAHVSPPTELIAEWAGTAHALAGVNCTGCHTDSEKTWQDQPQHTACSECHANEVKGFLAGRHGMRLAQELAPMEPGMARQPMKHDAHSKQLSCVACHTDHRFDTKAAAVDACLSCHDDQHSLAYLDSAHYALWLDEQSGAAEVGTGVSCATCHLPRTAGSDKQVTVQHNQNDNLRPNEKMVRTVCQNCHGVEFSIDALADRNLINHGFDGQPEKHIESAKMAKDWFDSKRKRRKPKDSASNN